ncbi:MAG: acyl-CoA transferase [Rhodobacteraceae bacterium GWE1_64_9]|nr:MAG: acyl-CoA transferase [Rhodobacteraceae bacterium GWE1_64_9]OHC49094.1 MAG: acyl-CoA transferase [Rhodobacteraceae bacterium GWF1_65_7]
MPTQSTAERLLASLHTLLSATMPQGTKVLRNAILPEKVPAGGVVILRDGDPGPPEVWLSPLGYYYEHRAEIEVVVDGNPAARDAAFDALRLTIGTALAADRTLGGLCDYITPEAPEPVLLAIDGNEGLKAAVIPVILAYSTTDPLL